MGFNGGTSFVGAVVVPSPLFARLLVVVVLVLLLALRASSTGLARSSDNTRPDGEDGAGADLASTQERTPAGEAGVSDSGSLAMGGDTSETDWPSGRFFCPMIGASLKIRTEVKEWWSDICACCGGCCGCCGCCCGGSDCCCGGCRGSGGD